MLHTFEFEQTENGIAQKKRFVGNVRWHNVLDRNGNALKLIGRLSYYIITDELQQHKMPSFDSPSVISVGRVSDSHAILFDSLSTHSTRSKWFIAKLHWRCALVLLHFAWRAIVCKQLAFFSNFNEWRAKHSFIKWALCSKFLSLAREKEEE